MPVCNNMAEREEIKTEVEVEANIEIGGDSE